MGRREKPGQLTLVRTRSLVSFPHLEVATASVHQGGPASAGICAVGILV